MSRLRGVGASRGRHRGQAGLTMIELLITIVLAGLVLGPIAGVAYLVLRQTKPTTESAKASKQLRLFRTVLADDWSSAAQIAIDPPLWTPSTTQNQATCNGDAFTVAPTKIRIAMITSYQVDGYRLRILYRETPNADGTIRVQRQICRHNASDGALGAWGLGGRSTDGPTYRLDTLLPRARALILPSGSGCNTTPPGAAGPFAPFPPCDMNVTVIAADGDQKNPFNAGSPFSSTAQRSTVRMHQQAGPLS